MASFLFCYMKKYIIFIYILSLSLKLASQNNTEQVANIMKNIGADFYSLIDNVGYTITSSHTSPVSNVTHYYLCQTYQDIEIKNAVMSLHFDKNGQLVNQHNQFLKSPQNKVNAIAPKFQAIEALRYVANDLRIDESLIPREAISQGREANKSTNFGMTKMSREPIKMVLKYHIMKDSSLRLAWDVSILELNSSDWWSMRVDATNGEILEKENYTLYCNFGHQTHTHNRECKGTKSMDLPKKDTRMMGFANIPNSDNVFPLGVESPNHGPRNLLVNPSNALASPYGWHDTNGSAGPEHTITRGNNVYAKEDTLDQNESILGYAPNGGPNLEFDFILDNNKSPRQNLNAHITNLFYWNNIVHDVLYHYGFTEAAGNFQENNYGRGGLANDYVRADALDGSGSNNANFSTPIDGSIPRMQMFEWFVGGSTDTFKVNTPSSKAGNYPVFKGAFGPREFNVTGQVILADSVRACSPITNNISGKIAMIDRGGCEFGSKAKKAQDAGAIAVIICNNVGVDDLLTMSSGAEGSQVTIPSVMLSKRTCDTLKLYLANLTVTISSDLGPIYDSGLDNGIIAHEYGHGLSIRLTGGPNNSSCLSGQEQMGEGWSDYLGLVLTAKNTDIGIKKRGIGTYVLEEPTTGEGIRPFPYSTDMTINPVTYDNIKTFSVPHGVGSVWCAMLWDMTWLFQEAYGYNTDFYNGSGGNNKAIALVVEAMKLQPCNPGFVTGRNAILKADSLINNGIHSCMIWKAFANRGLGASASQGSSNSRTDGIQAFDMPSSCRNVITIASNTGVGSLRNIVQNSLNNDTIKIAPYLVGKSLDLSDSPLTIDKNLVLKNPFNQELKINCTNNALLQINNGINFQIEDIIIDGATLANTVINNVGNLTLKNVLIEGNKQVNNSGVLNVLGVTTLRN